MPPQSLLDLLNAPMDEVGDIQPPPRESWEQGDDSRRGVPDIFNPPYPTTHTNSGLRGANLQEAEEHFRYPYQQQISDNIRFDNASPLAVTPNMSPSTPLHIPRTDGHFLSNNYTAARVESLEDGAQTSLRDISNTSQFDDQSLPFQQPAAGPHANTFTDARLSSPRVAADDPFKDLLTLPRSFTPIVPAHAWSTTPLSTFGDGPSDVGFLPRDREPGSHAARHPERQVNQPRNQKKKPKKSAGEDGDRDLMGQLKGDSDASKVKERLQSLRDVVEDELVAIASDFKQDLSKLRTQLMTGFVKPKGTSRTPSLYNAKMKEARKDTEVQVQLDKLGLTGRERQSWMQQHVRQQLASISPEEELELKDACLKDRETASIGVRVNYKATCTDFTKNIERISTEVNTLHFRTGAAFFGIAAKAHKSDNGRPQLITTPDLDNFIIEETGKTAAEFAHAMQFYVFQSADRHRKASTIPQLVQKLTKWMLSSMASLTGTQIAMVYADEEKIPADYGIKLVGWPPNVAFKSPTTMNKSELLLLSEAANAGSMRWIRLSKGEQDDARARRAAQKPAKSKKPNQKRGRKAREDSTDDSDDDGEEGSANDSSPTSDARKRQKKSSSASRAKASGNRSERPRRPQQPRRQKAATSAEMVADSDSGEEEASAAVNRGRMDGGSTEHTTGRFADDIGTAGSSSGAGGGADDLMPVRHDIGAPIAHRIPTAGSENDSAMLRDG